MNIETTAPFENFSIDFVSNTTKNTACQFHHTYELCFFYSGHRTYMLDSELFEAVPNSVVIIPPYTQHSTCGTLSATRTVLYFTKEYLLHYFAPDFTSELLNAFSKPSCVLTNPRDNVLSLVNHLQDAHFQGQKERAVLYFGMLLTAIKNAQTLPKKENDYLQQNIVARAIHYIEHNLSSITSLSILSTALNISLSYLEHTFKNSMGVSLMQYVIKSRLNYAAKQLLETNDPIKSIAAACGFHSFTHFSNTFKKHIGISPREYRNRR